MIFVQLLLLVAGFTMLVKGADWFVVVHPELHVRWESHSWLSD